MVYLQEDQLKEVKEGTGSLLLCSFACIVLLEIHSAIYKRLWDYLFIIPKIWREKNKFMILLIRLQLYLIQEVVAQELCQSYVGFVVT